MNVAVLRSIKPYWVYLICEGKKTIEIGKNIPRSDYWNKDTYIYCSKDLKSFNRIPKKYQEKYRHFLGNVVGVFLCENIESFTTDYRADKKQTERISKQSCVSWYDLAEYEVNTNCLYGWHISNLVIYNKPKKLNEFHKELPFKRPPQSWFYVEPLKEVNI